MDLLAKKSGLTSDRLIGVMDGPIHDAYERGELTEEQFYEQFRQTLPGEISFTRGDFFRAWQLMLGSPTGTMTFALGLIPEFHVWLASNTNPYHINMGIDGLLDGFTGRVYSFEIGYRKPERKFFEQALTLAETTVNKSLFIDDKIENIVTAKALGFLTVHYRSHEEFAEEISHILNDELS